MRARPRFRTPALATVCAVVFAFAAATPPAGAGGPELAALAVKAPDLIRRIDQARVRSVAVIDFTDLRGRTTELGRFLAEKLSGELANAGSKARVIDRLNLAALLEEQKLSTTGLLDPDTLHAIGRITGVDAIVTGRMTPLGDRIQVTLLALQTESAQILASDDIEIPRTETISELERRALTVDCPPGSALPEIVLDGPARQKFETNGYQFSLHGCQRAGDVIQCTVAVRNLDDERNLMLFGRSRVIFGDGGQEAASQISVSGEWATGALSRVGAALPPDVPSTVGVVFEGVPETESTLHQLELDFYGFEVSFEDVPIDR